ncbi:MAG: cache domain-containing protein [Thermodesulfobacteriota bacterium]|nr:cache domain-containing protein [Thermodesulfobacteriota bacterium]
MVSRKICSIFILFFVLLFFSSTGFGEPLSPKLCKEKVQAAAKLVKKEGKGAFNKLKDPDGEFRFGNDNGYIWVHNMECVMIMHPIKPSLVGKGLFELRDINGVYFFVAFNEMVEEYGKGWVPYMWPKPGQKDASQKISYVMLVEHGGNEYVVGSGMYDVTGDDIKKAFPNDKVYED